MTGFISLSTPLDTSLKSTAQCRFARRLGVQNSISNRYDVISNRAWGLSQW
jgi:hypothetical protein